MSLTLPAYLEDLKFLVGFEFPAGDEDALRRCGHAWRTAAASLRETQADAFAAGPPVLAGLDDATGAGFSGVWAQVAEPGHGFIDHLSRACDDLAAACEHAATEIEYAKYEFVAALAALAVTLTILAAMLVAGGLSAAGAPVAIAATQVSIRTLLLRLVASVVISSAINVALDGVAQAVQLFNGGRDAWDWATTGQAAESGAVVGAVGVGVFGLAGRFAPGLAGGRLGGAAMAGVAGVGGAAAVTELDGEQPSGSTLATALIAGALSGGPELLRHGRHAPVAPPLNDAVRDLTLSTEDGSDSVMAWSSPADGAPASTLAGGVSGPLADLAVDTDPADPPGPAGPSESAPFLSPQRTMVGEGHPVEVELGAQRPPLPDRVVITDHTGITDHTDISDHAGITDRTSMTDPGAHRPVPVGGRPTGPAAVVSPVGSDHPPGVPGATPHAGHLVEPGHPAGSDPAGSGRPAQPGPVPSADRGSESGPGQTRALTEPGGRPGPPPGHGTDMAVVTASGPPEPMASTPHTIGRPDGADPAGPGSPGPDSHGPDSPSVPAVAGLSSREVTDLVRETAFATPAGFAFYPDGDGVRAFAEAVQPTEGYVTLDVHGSRLGFSIDGHRLSAEQFARALRTMVGEGVLEIPEGSGIKLISCESAYHGPDSIAAALARELGVEVIAPDQVVWTSMDGDEIVASPVRVGGVIIPGYPPDGSWHRFGPDGVELPLDSDPGYHGPPVAGDQPLSQFHRVPGTEAHGPPPAPDRAAGSAGGHPVHRADPAARAFGRSTPGDTMFPGTHFSLDEVVQLCHGHTGHGNPALGRPSAGDIERALRRATPVAIPGRNAATFTYKETKVIINYDRPTRSTAVYLRRTG